MAEFPRVNPGDDLIIGADQWNAIGDVVSHANVNNHPPRLNQPSARSQKIIILNSSSADVDENSVLGIEGPVISPEDNERSFKDDIAFECVAPDKDKHEKRFCITTTPIAVGKLGEGIVSGIAAVKVASDSTDDVMSAAILDGETGYMSGGVGETPVIWRASGTGQQWAYVQLGDGGGTLPPGGKAYQVLQLDPGENRNPPTPVWDYIRVT